MPSLSSVHAALGALQLHAWICPRDAHARGKASYLRRLVVGRRGTGLGTRRRVLWACAAQSCGSGTQRCVLVASVSPSPQLESVPAALSCRCAGARSARNGERKLRVGQEEVLGLKR